MLLPSLHCSNRLLEGEVEKLKKEIETLKVNYQKLETVISNLNNLGVGPNLSMQQAFKTTHEPELDKPEKSPKFKCDFCDYESSSKKGVNIHMGAKHKLEKQAASSAISSTVANSPAVTLLKPPISCIRKVDGCLNTVNAYFDRHSAMCSNCTLFMEARQKCPPFPPNLCPCCHDLVGQNSYSLCQECLSRLSEDGFTESEWGSWVLDRDQEKIVCTQLDF